MHQKQEAGRLAKQGDRSGGGLHVRAGVLASLSTPEEVPTPGAPLQSSRALPALVGPDGQGQPTEPADAVSVVHERVLEFDGLLDPLVRAFAGTPTVPFPSDDTAARSATLPPDPALFKLLRRVAWGGCKRAGTLYLEFGSGELAGAGLTLTSSEGRVSVVLELPPGVGAFDWEQRLQSRLARRGLDVLSVTVR